VVDDGHDDVVGDVDGIATVDVIVSAGVGVLVDVFAACSHRR
jgi:hypothetical protein